MEHKEFEELLAKYNQGKCNEVEQAIVERWYWEYNEHPINLTEDEINATLLSISQKLPKPVVVKKLNTTSRIITIAASIAIFLTIGFYFLQRNRTVEQIYANDIQPGGNKAILTLVNGVSFDLNEAASGQLAVDNGVKIIKMKDGQLLFKFSPSTVQATPAQMDSITGLVTSAKPVKEGTGLNAVSTPRGGQYHIALPDGTNVWINAGSTLRFPSSFEDMPERRVQLNGEAYFEVARVKSVFGMQKRARRIPFIVQTNKQEITVLGTHFNVNSYDDESNVKTTLLEGLIKVSSASANEIIKPGQQAVNDVTQIIVKQADTEMAVAWKNGEFTFHNEILRSIMRKVSRWYNVEIAYTNPEVGNKPFSGTVSKYKNVSEVLKLLQVTGEVKFKVEGRKITVLK
jgi:transmembrane sensor